MADEEEKKPAVQSSEPPKDDPTTPEDESVTNAEEQGNLGEDEDIDDHEVIHNDEFEKENPKIITRVNFMLVGLSFLGMLATLGAIFFLISSIETGATITDDGGVTPLHSLEGDIYYQVTDGASARLTSLDGQSEQFAAATGGALQPADNNRNPTWQISRRGNVVAYQLAQSNQVTVQASSEPQTAFGEETAALRDWVLTRDGRYVIGLFGTRLVRYDVSNNTAIVLDEDFTNGGQEGSGRIFYGTDGTIRWFNFTGGNNLLQIIASVHQIEPMEPVVINSPRIRDDARLSYNSLSPDGQNLVFRFAFEGQDYLGLISLNSQTVRTMYQVTSGAVIDEFIWSSDSRTMVVLENQGGALQRIERLDTGPLTRETLVSSETEGLNTTSPLAEQISWTADGLSISFVNGGSLFTYDAEVAEAEQPDGEENQEDEQSDQQPEPEPRLVKRFDVTNSADVYGWFNTEN